MHWKHNPQEQAGTYLFSGTFYVTSLVSSQLTSNEISAIYLHMQVFVMENGGADYLQVFENGKGAKLYFIDQLNREMIQSGGYEPEHNHCTLMFSSEY
jgi:hypothetical protein